MCAAEGMGEVGLVDKATRRSDIGKGQAMVVEHADGALHAASTQVCAR
jgi:hypothetical protein